MDLRTLLPVASQAGGWPWLRRIMVGLLIATLLSGCVIRVVYNQLDWLTLWYIEDYVDLDRVQEEQAKALIDQTLSWHRANQIPRYAALARNILAGLDGPISEEFVADRYAEVVQLWEALLRQAAPGVAALLKTLSDRQVSELFAQLDEDNAELSDDYSGISLEERRVKQGKAIIRAFRRFTGRLSPAQEELVRAETEKSHDVSADWLQRRAAWQGEFRSLMHDRQSDPAFAARFADLVLNPNQFDSPGYRDLVEENQRRFFRLVANVLGTLSPAQARHLKDRFTTDANDFDELTGASNQRPGVP